MELVPAADAEIAALVALVNRAFRGAEGEPESWNVERFIAGQRTDERTLRQELAADPAAALLVWRRAGDGAPLGCVRLDPAGDDAWYLGMLTVDPALQGQGAGARLLAAAEDAARTRGARRIRMTVINVRDALIAWYERRGYAATGERRPFPYGDDRFGRPLRDDLDFVVLEKPLP